MVQSFNEKKVSKVTCGWGHTAVITEDGQVYIWGRNNSAQLGLGHSEHKYAKLYNAIDFGSNTFI